jgi:hypothetical protein
MQLNLSIGFVDKLKLKMDFLNMMNSLKIFQIVMLDFETMLLPF